MIIEIEKKNIETISKCRSRNNQHYTSDELHYKEIGRADGPTGNYVMKLAQAREKEIHLVDAMILLSYSVIPSSVHILKVTKPQYKPHYCVFHPRASPQIFKCVSVGGGGRYM